MDWSSMKTPGMVLSLHKKMVVRLHNVTVPCVWFFYLQVQHPAAKMVVMASHMQEQEVGDGTNFVLVFAGALLELAEELLRMGLSVSECVCASAKNLHDVEEATSMIRPAVMSKQYGNEDFLANLIAQACGKRHELCSNTRANILYTTYLMSICY
uniref:Uncharacterized protein n=1 Tax=Hucho hucho TaxID=62062 RepID=A0A4W5LSQ3_9TELE